MHEREREMLKLGCAIAALVVLGPADALAQTWARGTTPRVRELVAVDRTGEAGWPFGAEDLASDGATAFAQQEQSVDLRTAYATTDAQRFWVRAYVSATTPPLPSVALYVFIDADHTATTGGDAVATQVDPALTGDPSPGGYEYLFGVDGGAQVLGLWQWTTQWTNQPLTGTQAAAETDLDLDPIRIGADQHGYLQGEIDLGLVGLTTACDAALFFRSVGGTTGVNDLEVGTAAQCVPPDANTNGVPNIIDNRTCTTDADCPAGGACINGACVFTSDCTTAADCAANQVCTGGFCVAAPAGNCTTTADCTGGLVCQGGQCMACTAAAQCGTGSTCAPNGTCVAGTSGGTGSPTDLAPGEEIQGGACACSLPGSALSRWSGPSFALAAFLGAALRRRRRR